MGHCTRNMSYDVLAERELARLRYSLRPSPEPARTFYSVAKSLQYRRSNRYSNILAYDRTAVVGPHGYLNANVVRDGRGQWWVAAQAPLPSTFHAFWHAILDRSASRHSAVVEHNQPAIRQAAIVVQLTGWEENGVSKADNYLEVTEYPKTAELPAMSMHETSQTTLNNLSSTLTELRLREADAMMIYHYHFTAWPDHGVPEGDQVGALKRLVYAVGRHREELGGCEVWVHCSAGVGRTGAFIALSSLLLQPDAASVTQWSPLPPLPDDLAADPVASTIDALREWRGGLVQTREQMALVYQLVNDDAPA